MPTTNDNSIVTKGILRYFYGKLDNNVNTLLSLKVDKEDGKGLSTNDFTNAYKNKLDGLSNYSLPIASGSKLGGIKTGYASTGKTYGVQVDADGDAYVSVPWTDTNTTYNVVSKTANGLAPMLPNETGTTKFLRQDGTWVAPPNTTYSLSTTSANGLLRQLNGRANSFMAGDGNWKDIVSVIDSRISAKILTFFPVGTVIQTTNSANPSTYLGGTWEAFAPGRVLIGAGQGNDGTTSMSFTSLGTYGKYKHQHNPGTLGADWNHFASGNRMYMDYRGINNGTNYPENMRLYIESSDLQSMTDRTDGETNASQIGISGKTENTDNIMPGIGVYMFRRTATEEILDPPRGLSVVETTPTSATLSWDVVADATGYALYLYDESTTTQIKKISPITRLDYTITGLEPETWYSASLSSINSDGKEGEKTDIISFETSKLKNVKVLVNVNGVAKEGTMYTNVAGGNIK